MNHRILIIDDEAAMRAHLSNLLSQVADVQVECAANDIEANAMVEANAYDVALVDLKLNPKPTGQLVGFRYACLLASKGCQVIIVTGNTGENLSEFGVALNCSDIVTKPFVDSVLMGHVERALRWCDLKRAGVAPKDLPTDLKIDPFKNCCEWQGKVIHLTPTELQLVKLIWDAEGKSLDLNHLRTHLRSGSNHAVTQHITNIRAKFVEVDANFKKIACHGGAYFWVR